MSQSPFTLNEYTYDTARGAEQLGDQRGLVTGLSTAVSGLSIPEDIGGLHAVRQEMLFRLLFPGMEWRAIP